MNENGNSDTYEGSKAVPNVSGLDLLDNIFHDLYIIETHIFTDSYKSAADMASL